MVEQRESTYETPGSIVKMACPWCGFVSAAFSAEELRSDTTKRKRCEALQRRQQFCGGCMRTVRKLTAAWEP